MMILCIFQKFYEGGCFATHKFGGQELDNTLKN